MATVNSDRFASNSGHSRVTPHETVKSHPLFHASLHGRRRFAVGETRKIAAILVADMVGYSRLAGADEDRTLSRLRGLRSDLIDPAIAAHTGAPSSAPGTAASSSFAAWLMQSAAP